MTEPTFKRRESVVCREVAGESFLVPIHGRMADLNELFVLNEVGNSVWEHLSEQRSLKDVAAHISNEFEVDAEQALADTAPFVKELVEAGLADEWPVAQ